MELPSSCRSTRLSSGAERGELKEQCTVAECRVCSAGLSVVGVVRSRRAPSLAAQACTPEPSTWVRQQFARAVQTLHNDVHERRHEDPLQD